MKGHIFKSETDSEVIAHLLEEDYVHTGDLRVAMRNTSKKLAGAFSFIAAFSDGTIAGVDTMNRSFWEFQMTAIILRQRCCRIFELHRQSNIPRQPRYCYPAGL